jgi:hypothetical protein
VFLGCGPRKAANLVIMLAMIVALAYWGFEVAPKARWPVPVGVRLPIDLNAPTAGDETRSVLRWKPAI